jgi:hypothetical protein
VVYRVPVALGIPNWRFARLPNIMTKERDAGKAAIFVEVFSSGVICMQSGGPARELLPTARRMCN